MPLLPLDGTGPEVADDAWIAPTAVLVGDVTVGSVDNRGVAIVSGLSGQEAVVQSAGAFLNPGQKVLPRRAAAR